MNSVFFLLKEMVSLEPESKKGPGLVGPPLGLGRPPSGPPGGGPMGNISSGTDDLKPPGSGPPGSGSGSRLSEYDDTGSRLSKYDDYMAS